MTLRLPLRTYKMRGGGGGGGGGFAFHILHPPLPNLQRTLAAAALSHLCRRHQHPQPLTAAREPWLFTALALLPPVATTTAYISRHHHPSVPSPESLPLLLQPAVHCISTASWPCTTEPSLSHSLLPAHHSRSP